MERFEYPSREGAKEVARLLGVAPDVMVKCQDWQYTFPVSSDLSRYQQIYEYEDTSDLAKRVLGCFIFECLEDHLRDGGSESLVRSSLKRLASDYHVHQHEFHYWSLLDDEHYDRHPEDGWSIMSIVREQLKQAEQGVDDQSPTRSAVDE